MSLSDDNGDPSCPIWPPNVFGLAADILSSTGAYIHAVDLLESQFKEGDEGNGLLSVDRIDKLADQWRRQLEQFLEKNKSGFDDPQQKRLRKLVPKEIRHWWKAIIDDENRLTNDRAHMRTINYLLNLFLVADCAGRDMGKGEGTLLTQFAHITNTKNKHRSLCLGLDAAKICVLPKSHTPGCGLTLRSLSHHLCLVPKTEVWSRWHPHIITKEFEIFNLLLLPWPMEIQHADFQLKADYHPDRYRSLSKGYGYFSFQRRLISGFKARLSKLLDSADSYANQIHGIILPELSLIDADLEILKRIAHEKNVFFCAGLHQDSRNLMVLDFNGLSSNENTRDFLTYMQDKHHRWFLERNQIQQYGLGGFLPSHTQWWEFCELKQRRINFFTLLPSRLSLCALICEDLARQDPVAEVIRAVGPNLVIALLMDGPQLNFRWPARYATVLAEDPGSSVLTLTNFGMVQLSNALQNDPSRVVALWQDRVNGVRELALGKDEDAIILNLLVRENTEVSADGRQDHHTRTLLYVSHHGLRSQV